MATIELEAPESTTQHFGRTALHVVSPEAENAVRLLETDAAESGDEQREGSTPVTIRLVKPVQDTAAVFAAQAGETFDAYTDADGNTWIPLPGGDICLEAEEFEIVESEWLARDEEELAKAAAAAAGTLSGSHTILSAINGVATLPLALAINFGVRHAWESGEPCFGLTGSAANGYLCVSYTVNPADMTYNAKFVVFPGSAIPAWGTTALT